MFDEITCNQRAFFKRNATISIEFRKKQLQTLKGAILANVDELTDALQKDLGRNKQYSEILEIMSALAEIDYMYDNVAKWSAKEFKERTLPYIANGVFTIRQPLGVCLIIAPWNYPLALCLLPLIAAIAAGNTVIIKPSEVALNTAKAIAKMLGNVFEPNYIAVILGGVKETTQLLQLKFDHIFYTGNIEVGKIIMREAAKNLTPVTLELGGKSPVIVCKTTNIDLAAKRIAWGKYMNCGQTCIAPDFAIIEASVKDEFVSALQKHITAFYGENSQQAVDYPRIINKKHYNRLISMLNSSKGQILIEHGKRDEDALFIPPIVIEIGTDDALMKDEIFGPILPFIAVQNIEESIHIINDLPCPLALYLFSTNKKFIHCVKNNTKSGQLVVNDVVIQFVVDTLPFGGVGESGIGRYTGKYGFDTFSHEKAVLTAGFFAEPLFAARYPPVTEAKMKQLRLITGTR